MPHQPWLESYNSQLLGVLIPLTSFCNLFLTIWAFLMLSLLSKLLFFFFILPLIAFRAPHKMCALCLKPLPCSPWSWLSLCSNIPSPNRPFPAHLESAPICPLMPHYSLLIHQCALQHLPQFAIRCNYR